MELIWGFLYATSLQKGLRCNTCSFTHLARQARAFWWALRWLLPLLTVAEMSFTQESPLSAGRQ